MIIRYDRVTGEVETWPPAGFTKDQKEKVFKAKWDHMSHTLKSAHKRCLSMGSGIAWRPEFNTHHLAPVMDNYRVMIDVELELPNPDLAFVLRCVYHQAERINAFCDSNRVKDSEASQYWLERWLWTAERVFGDFWDVQ